MPENVLYNLDKITDIPEFEGFAFVREVSLRNKAGRFTWDFGPDDVQTKGRAWTIRPLSPLWSPQPVVGRVQSHNDYPCVNLTIPAFSRRAVDALHDFLEPNGELLPLVSSIGEYFAYNITTVVDILDHQQSDIIWFDEKHDLAIRVRRYECINEKLTGLSIFRLVEMPSSTFVNQVFIDRVRQHGLQGFEFTRLWPLSSSERGENDKPLS
jgi:hypothetical protein